MTYRVFPRRTNATPDDQNAFVGDPPLLLPLEADSVEISVTFTWDLPEAERLAKEWSVVAPVEIGGPATGAPGDDFVPGKYLKSGYVITSRGCRNRCWFCSVWKREGNIRELPITEGYNVLDDNLLACSRKHISDVFLMLYRQAQGRVQFTGGLEAALLKPWHVEQMRVIHPKQMFFAYDTPEDLEPLQEAGKLLKSGGFKITNPLRAYVLVGYPRDTFEAAEKRLFETIDAGFMPMAMLYRNDQNETDGQWRKFQKEWARPAIINTKIKERTG